MAIKLDASPSNTVVITCTECDYWAAIRFGMIEAHRCAVAHEKLMHWESDQARQAARRYRQRHSADSLDVTAP